MLMYKLWGALVSLTLLFAATPSSTNYTLKSYDIGTGGAMSSSSNYGLQSGTGSQSGSMQSSGNYKAQTDGRGVLDANTPPAPTFTNPSNYYDRLELVVATGDNPSDTKYLIAISTDSFATTQYVQTDHSVGTSQALANYQTYAAWGGASGFLIVGLTPATTYQVKIKAMQGSYTGSPFGPVATAATVATSLSFGLTTTLSAMPPFDVNFGTLSPDTVATGSADAQVSVTTNAYNGGGVYVKDAYGGLYSPTTSNTIASVSTNLATALTGYGAQVAGSGQTSGGPFAAVSPFNGGADNVGGLATILQPILATAGPVNGGSGTVRLKAKAAYMTPSAPDYSDTVTFIAAMSF